MKTETKTDQMNVLQLVPYNALRVALVCVLTCPSSTPGKPLADFLIFGPRWDVANHT